MKILIPLPCDATDIKCKTGKGYAEFFADKECVVWEIDYFKGEELTTLNYSFKLPSLISPN